MQHTARNRLSTLPARLWLTAIRLTRTFARTVAGMADRRRQRLHLAELDDRLLADIGLTRCDVKRECAKPFWRTSGR
ncbi:DUF1127 domain-containing protein [Nitratireductor thuwali]|uniref:YjiS-like domain-containing protein n=1 Tax=Nitratireductor thuwali TaxID=2267699 RepID=A0ABY5MIY1_9HYPH|nr:hypothetical protein NTH_02435 [Nitratireductor thuwali]